MFPIVLPGWSLLAALGGIILFVGIGEAFSPDGEDANFMDFIAVLGVIMLFLGVVMIFASAGLQHVFGWWPVNVKGL